MPDSVRLVVTGTPWMGHAIGSVATAMETIFKGAQSELLVTAYSIGPGAEALLEDLERAAGRGVKVVLVVNRFALQPMPVRTRLVRLARRHPWFVLLDFRSDNDEEELHAKVVVADRRIALVGSANLSRRGLLTNHELALVVEGPAVLEIARALDLLLSDGRLVHAVDPDSLGPVLDGGEVQ